MLDALVKYQQRNTRIQNRPAVLGVESNCVEVELLQGLPVLVWHYALPSPLSEVDVSDINLVSCVALHGRILDEDERRVENLGIVPTQRHDARTPRVVAHWELLLEAHGEPRVGKLLLEDHLVHERRPGRGEPDDAVLDLRGVPPGRLCLAREDQREAVVAGN